MVIDTSCPSVPTEARDGASEVPREGLEVPLMFASHAELMARGLDDVGSTFGSHPQVMPARCDRGANVVSPTSVCGLHVMSEPWKCRANVVRNWSKFGSKLVPARYRKRRISGQLRA